jgi:hypothetical protein
MLIEAKCKMLLVYHLLRYVVGPQLIAIYCLAIYCDAMFVLSSLHFIVWLDDAVMHQLLQDVVCGQAHSIGKVSDERRVHLVHVYTVVGKVSIKVDISGICSAVE